MWKQDTRDDSILGNVFLKLHYEHYELKIP
jgi:hypothetical protein